MKEKIKFEIGSDNVFADIGVSSPQESLAKAKVAREVNWVISGMTQIKAAALLGIDQPRVSALKRGRLSVFSLEKLMDFAERVGCRVEISESEPENP